MVAKTAKKKTPARKKASTKKPAVKRPRGRLSKLTETIAYAICTRLADGESLVEICGDPKMPCRKTVNNWLVAATHEDAKPLEKSFLHRYARAREFQQDTHLDECVPIADGLNNYVETEEQDADGTIVKVRYVERDAIRHAQLRIETRLRMAEKLAPKKYGPRVDLTHKGDPEHPLRQIVDRCSSEPDVPPGAMGKDG